MTDKSIEIKLKERREDAGRTEEDTFVAPDGGWGWMVVLASGFANFCIFPVVQNFGLLFRGKFAELGITSSQTTTIINTNGAVTACIGLVNGPIFRKFTYRQISLAGALICAISISVLSTMKTFGGVLLFFSVLYGAGTGIAGSANALALNTYFKVKRRVATGYSWTCTGLGPIIMPQVITLLIPIYGMEGTVLIFGGFTFNAVVCALLLQPVSWHAKKKETVVSATEDEKVNESGAALLDNTQSKSVENIHGIKKLTAENRLSQMFGSQYLYYDDDEQGASGLDVFGTGTPMMSRANDGWYSRQSIAASNTSLASNKTFKRENSQKNLSRYPSLSLSRQSSWKALSRGPSLRNLNKQNSEIETGKNLAEKTAKRKLSTLPSAIHSPLIKVTESCEHPEEECLNDNCNNEECLKRKLTQIFEKKADYLNVQPIAEVSETEENEQSQEPEDPFYKRYFKALVIFFDLDLLRDPIYVNLTLGITFANYAEINFSLLTPFILGDYGLTNTQVATAMSILAGCDVATRMAIPFVSEWIGWQNRFLFLLGVCMMAMGRFVLAYIQNYIVILFLAIWIGIGKAFKTVFMALVIPSHVPLKRLPAASGLQLLVSGCIYLILGPLVGWIRDQTGNYDLALQCLNIFTSVTVISWLTESWITKRRQKKKLIEKQNNGDIEKS